ncbi:MarR family winged helix-turn-helix transcriptional regulator [Rhizobium paknamense]|uniref:DNA-binding MarR family transcriptional regulator n=1 Tax=Rhizobium paknamense TaxID=1206817 RepID=A0ABU0IHT3_9HYPH|nr:MarR family winged helix-turn-helix transcriptional regulator [Rhizobium paknamense]MDQ0457819.1 DNA-binding MarR family transcriptional regulator [Rhizobium paknamense]
MPLKPKSTEDVLQDNTCSAVEPPEKLEVLIGYHLRRASIHDLNGAVAALNDVNTRPVPASVLLTIVENPGVSSADICRMLGMQRANIVSILSELEGRGLFVRETDPADQRIQKLYPTRHGQEEAKTFMALLQAHEDTMLQRLSAAERQQLRMLLAKIWQDDGV